MVRAPLLGITTSEVRRPEINHPLPDSEPPWQLGLLELWLQEHVG
jgi:hypothetical protein